MIARFTVEVDGLPATSPGTAKEEIERALADAFRGRLRIDGSVEMSDFVVSLSRDELDKPGPLV